jgi:glycerophosphoryl diester phosphodiesterase
MKSTNVIKRTGNIRHYTKDRSGKKVQINFKLLLCLLGLFIYNKTNAQTTINSFKIKNVKDLRSFFTYKSDRIPLLCGHRGGATIGFPENCIATFENTLQKIPAFFELDPRLTKDSVVIVMHDATLDRTTNGKGKISDYTWKELQQLKLKDPEGNITQYNIPLLDDILRWAKGKTILMLDKKDVPLQTILQKIRNYNAESFVLISTYAAEEAAFYHKQNKNIMFEAFILHKEGIKEYENAGIPWQNIVAYVSKSKDKSLYDALHERKVMCIYYTTPVLEKMSDSTERATAYQNVLKSGGDILLSDRIFEVSNAIQSLIPQKSSQLHFFTKMTFE